MTTEAVLYVPMKEALYNELVVRYSKPGRPASGIQGYIDHAVESFLERTSEDYPVLVSGAPKGYYWQSVFLPNGSELRITIHTKQHFAVIENEKVRYDGQWFTPASWANHIAGHSRNAWRDIYIKRPTDSDWIFANTLRR